MNLGRVIKTQKEYFSAGFKRLAGLKKVATGEDFSERASSVGQGLVGVGYVVLGIAWMFIGTAREILKFA
jgi:hypothetical protein